MIPRNGSPRPPSQEAGFISVPVYAVIDDTGPKERYFQFRDERDDKEWRLVFTDDVYSATLLTVPQVSKVQDWLNQKSLNSRVFYIGKAVESKVNDESRLYRRR